ncbi:MAG: hypothetical protein ABI605_13400 [Rhizobacter sp.]
MWPLSRPPARECLRIGRLAAERWAGQGMGLELKASWPLPANAIDTPECLAQALTELCAEKPQGKVSLVLESAWLPVLMADTGGSLLGVAEAEALMRHRLSEYHAGPGDELSTWDIRVDYRAGDRFALGYGLAPRVKQALLEATARAEIRLQTLVPAFVWGWRRLRPPIKTGWWLWPEQDRMLLARADASRWVALNPAVPLVNTPSAIERIVQAESARWGLPASEEGVTVASWQPPLQLPAPGQRLKWRSLLETA